MSNTTLGEKAKKVLPKHVAIIMDGNGRWAKSQGKNRVFGHKKGATVNDAPWEKSEGRLDLRLSFVNLEVTTVEILSVHRGDRGGCFVGVAVGDEGEATRSAGLTIHGNVNISDVAELAESVAETVFGRVE